MWCLGFVAMLLSNFTFHKQSSLLHQYSVVRCLHVNVRCKHVVWVQNGYVWKQRSKQERLQKRRSGRSSYSFRQSMRMPALPVKGSTQIVGAAALLANILVACVLDVVCLPNLHTQLDHTSQRL